MTTALCRDAQDPSAFCRFAHTCHESRQRIQTYGLATPMWGNECWAFQKMRERAAYPDMPVDEIERRAIVEVDGPQGNEAA